MNWFKSRLSRKSKKQAINPSPDTQSKEATTSTATPISKSQVIQPGPGPGASNNNNSNNGETLLVHEIFDCFQIALSERATAPIKIAKILFNRSKSQCFVFYTMSSGSVVDINCLNIYDIQQKRFLGNHSNTNSDHTDNNNHAAMFSGPNAKHAYLDFDRIIHDEDNQRFFLFWNSDPNIALLSETTTVIQCYPYSCSHNGHDDNHDNVVTDEGLQPQAQAQPLPQTQNDNTNDSLRFLFDISLVANGGNCVHSCFLSEHQIVLLILSNGYLLCLKCDPPHTQQQQENESVFRLQCKIDMSLCYKHIDVDIDIDNNDTADGKIARKYTIIAADVNRKRKRIAFVEQEFAKTYYLQIFSLYFIFDYIHDSDDTDTDTDTGDTGDTATAVAVTKTRELSSYLIASRLIHYARYGSRRHRYAPAEVNYKCVHLRSNFAEILQSKQQNATQNYGLLSGTSCNLAIFSAQTKQKRSNCEYVVDSLLGVNPEHCSIVFSPCGDKLLYHSKSDMFDELFVVDTHTMNTMTVSAKGTPLGWMFNDYLIVNNDTIERVIPANSYYDYQSRRIKTKTPKRKAINALTIELKGFITETSIADILMAVPSLHLFDIHLCLVIGRFVGSSDERRDARFTTYRVMNGSLNKNRKNIEIGAIKPLMSESQQLLSFDSVFALIDANHNQDIAFFDCSNFLLSSNAIENFVAFSDGHGIAFRNTKKTCSPVFKQIFRNLYE